MTWFNTYESDGDGLTRKVVTEVNLREIPMTEWSDDELGFRLAVIFPKVDGYGHMSASEEIKAEVADLLAAITARGYDPISNLQYNEQVVGWGWLPGFRKLGDAR